MTTETNTRDQHHPVDHNLRSLEMLEKGIEAQLELEYQLMRRDEREIALAKCFPEGRFILQGSLCGYARTIDPEVSRSYLMQGGLMKGILYINTLRKVCVAVDWLR